MKQAKERLSRKLTDAVFAQGRVNAVQDEVHLVVGLGGVGCAMLRAVKTEVDAACCDWCDSEKNTPQVYYLAIDTDREELFRCAVPQQGDSAVLDDRQMLLLRWPAPGVPPIAAAARYQYILSWMDREMLDGNGVGPAASIRQVGRAMLFMNLQQLRDRVLGAVSQALCGVEGRPTVWVHLLSGLTGGTGSGMLLDLAYLIHHWLEGHFRLQAAVLGWLALPEAAQERTDRPKPFHLANCYATLQELEHLMSLPERGGRFTQQYDANTVVDSCRRPFDVVHLLGCPDNDPELPPQSYRRMLHTVAQGIRFLVTDESGSGRSSIARGSRYTVPAARLIYDTARRVAEAQYRSRPEWGWPCVALSAAEYALPAAAMQRYAFGLLARPLDAVRQNTPTPQQVEELRLRVGLTEADFTAMVTGAVPKFLEGEPHEWRYRSMKVVLDWMWGRLLGAVEDCADAWCEQLRCRLKQELTGALTDPERGPYWVHRMVWDHLLPVLKPHTGLSVQSTALRSALEQELQQWDRMPLRWAPLDKRNAVRWNEMFDQLVGAVAAERCPLYRSAEADPRRGAVAGWLQKWCGNRPERMCRVLDALCEAALQEAAAAEPATGGTQGLFDRSAAVWAPMVQARVGGMDHKRMLQVLLTRLETEGDCGLRKEEDLLALRVGELLQWLRQYGGRITVEEVLAKTALTGEGFALLDDALLWDGSYGRPLGLLPTLQRSAPLRLRYDPAAVQSNAACLIALPAHNGQLAAAAPAVAAQSRQNIVQLSADGTGIRLLRMELTVPLRACRQLALYRQTARSLGRKPGMYLYRVGDAAGGCERMGWAALPDLCPPQSGQ